MFGIPSTAQHVPYHKIFVGTIVASFGELIGVSSTQPMLYFRG